MSEYAAPIDPKEGLFEFGDFLGLRNNVTPEMFAPSDLVTALNVDINDSLDLKRRKGYSAPVTSAVDRSLFAAGPTCLGVGSNALKLINPDFSTVTLRTGLAPERPLAYAALADRVYYSNGVETGCVRDGGHRTWGLTLPPMPSVTAGPGALARGKYQFAVTYLRADGQESGARLAGTLELIATGGISLSALVPSSDPTVTHKAIYAASVGGETLFRTGIIDNTTTAFLIDEIRPDAAPLVTQFLAPPPAGDFIGYWKGWMLVAKDDRLYPSEPYAPELFDLRKALPFSDRITMIAPLNNKTDGVWIGTDTQVIFVDGESPEAWKYKVAADYGVIPGTLRIDDGGLLGDGAMSGDQVAYFATTRGLCVGNVGGYFKNMTEARFAYPAMDRGAGVVRRHQGMAQFLVTLQGSEVPGNVAS